MSRPWTRLVTRSGLASIQRDSDAVGRVATDCLPLLANRNAYDKKSLSERTQETRIVASWEVWHSPLELLASRHMIGEILNQSPAHLVAIREPVVANRSHCGWRSMSHRRLFAQGVHIGIFAGIPGLIWINARVKENSFCLTMPTKCWNVGPSA